MSNPTPNPHPHRSIIELTSAMDQWARLVCLYVDPRDNNAFKMEAVLTPEWIVTGGWQYLSEVVAVMTAEMIGPLGVEVLPDIEWRVLPFYTHIPPTQQLIIPHNP